MSESDIATPHGVHLVGSAPFPSTDTALRYFSDKIPRQLRRMPDGECVERAGWVAWQFQLFPQHALASIGGDSYNFGEEENTVDIVRDTIAGLPKLETGYDDAAVASYATFKTLKEEGVIPAKTRFQVSLPTPIAVMIVLGSTYRAGVEPLYTDALVRALARIQAKIPPHELAIQWDCAVEIAFLEKMPFWKPWFEPTLENLTARLQILVEKIHPEVEIGFHLCYGDHEHKHYLEPNDTAVLVKFAEAILDRFHRADRPINWVHLPVPKNRDDVAYFAPLGGLKLPEQTELYLGLVHANDLEGTERRIQAANKAGIVKFGLATECGMGRTPENEIDSIFDIFARLAKPYIP